MKFFAFFVALIAAAVAQEADYGDVIPMDSAFILALKSTLSKFAVEGMEMVMEYRLYNVGDRAALHVTFDDRHSFPNQSFEIVSGSLQAKWEKIAPRSEVVHVVVVRPLGYGEYNHTAAIVTYYPTDEAKDVRIGFSSAAKEGYIFSLKDYERRFSTKCAVWSIAALLFLLPNAVIYCMWRSMGARYGANTVSKKSK